MPLTKNSIRALAASIAFVAACATVAGAAVFQLPILGFGPASAVSTRSAPVPARSRVMRLHLVAPRKVIRTRYVTDIVHRPSPVRAAPARVVPTPPITPVSPPPAVVVAVRAVTPPTTAVPVAHTAARAGEHSGSEPEREPRDHAPSSAGADQ